MTLKLGCFIFSLFARASKGNRYTWDNCSALEYYQHITVRGNSDCTCIFLFTFAFCCFGIGKKLNTGWLGFGFVVLVVVVLFVCLFCCGFGGFVCLLFFLNSILNYLRRKLGPIKTNRDTSETHWKFTIYTHFNQ